MKKWFYAGVFGLVCFEIANVYFIMPMPGVSQEIHSIALAYTLHSWRWAFRAFFFILMLLGAKPVFFSTQKKWLPLISLLLMSAVLYAVHFTMAADTMFYQPGTLSLKSKDENVVSPERLVLGVSYEGYAKAYPIQYLGYHHQVRDRIGSKPIMVTYCTVCRTGRVFEPLVKGKIDVFRLVGMDRYNAMFEDHRTKSWWRQATGEAVAGELKGQRLPEFPSVQTTLGKWMALYPHTMIMQPDVAFQVSYDSMSTYEKGKLTGRLTRRDTASWREKSWVVGVETGLMSKAYDWNLLQKERILYDVLAGKPIAVVLSKDNSSFVVLERTDAEQRFILKNDTLLSPGSSYDFMGKSLHSSGKDLKRIRAYQEYWHSWREFHPLTQPFDRN